MRFDEIATKADVERLESRIANLESRFGALAAERAGPVIDDRITVPFLAWVAEAGFSHDTGYDLLAAGEVDSITIGAKRLIVLSTWLDYVERRRRGLDRDAAERAAAAERYRASLDQRRNERLTAGRLAKPQPKAPRRAAAIVAAEG